MAFPSGPNKGAQSSVTQMYEHELNPVKGWPSPYALDKSAAVADGETGILEGMAMSLDSNGELVKGLSAAGAVAILALQNLTDLDVSSTEGNVAGGNMSGLVCIGPYEIQTTEFKTTDVFAPNDLLTSDLTGGTTPGEIRLATTNETVLGVVSNGVDTNEYSIDVLQFWTYYLPNGIIA